jgi:RNA polymerase sigma factor for flagellar operon FliA
MMMHTRSYAAMASTSPERLVADHLNLVRKIAWHTHGRVGRRIEIEDLMQAGFVGLVDASHRYEPKPGVTFGAYAAIRIRGAMIDHLRANSSLTRASMAMQQKIRTTTHKLEGKLMRAPTPPEIAEALGMTLADFEAASSEIAASQVQSLDEVYTDTSGLFGDNGPGVEEKLMAGDLKRLLREALTRLPEREALVLQLYYVEELNVYEIAEVLDVTTGRVSQIKKSAVEKLQKTIAELQGESVG